jgi:hypothetical protein
LAVQDFAAAVLGPAPAAARHLSISYMDKALTDTHNWQRCNITKDVLSQTQGTVSSAEEYCVGSVLAVTPTRCSCCADSACLSASNIPVNIHTF